MKPVSRLTTFAALGTALAAQQQSMAPFAAAPAAISFTRAAGRPNALLKCEGFETLPPIVWPAGSGPSFDLDRAFRALISPGCSIPQAGALPDVDAMSLGLDWVLADGNGRVDVPPGRWGAITFSVANNAAGVSGSEVAKAAAAPEGPGADVFSFVLRGSTVPGYLVNRAFRAIDSTEMGLPTTARVDLDGLDQYIPLYRLDPMVATPSRGVPQQPTLYFSVSNATLGTVPASWWAGTTPSGATILAMTWNSAAGKWGCVQPWKIYRDLGLDACEDIDALALDLVRARMLFSTRFDRACRPVDRPQILFLDPSTDAAAPVEYTNPDGTPVSDAGGLLRTDEVDAICSLDPFAPLRDQTGVKINTMRVAYGTPEIPLTFPGVPRSLEGTSFLACWPGFGPAELRAYGLGWPGGGPAPGFAAAYVTFAGAAVPPIFMGGFARNPGSTFVGDPLELVIPIPAPVRFLNPALRVQVTWVAIDTGSGTFGQAHRVGIDL